MNLIIFYVLDVFLEDEEESFAAPLRAVEK